MRVATRSWSYCRSSYRSCEALKLSTALANSADMMRVGVPQMGDSKTNNVLSKTCVLPISSNAVQSVLGFGNPELSEKLPILGTSHDTGHRMMKRVKCTLCRDSCLCPHNTHTCRVTGTTEATRIVSMLALLRHSVVLLCAFAVACCGSVAEIALVTPSYIR